jgi:hypothetical protein
VVVGSVAYVERDHSSKTMRTLRVLDAEERDVLNARRVNVKKIQGRVGDEEWETVMRRLGARTNQEAIEFLIRNQMTRWAKHDSGLNERLVRFNERVKAELGKEGEE